MTARAYRSDGSIQLAHPMSNWAILFLSAIVIASFISYAAFGSFAKKTPSSGLLVSTGGAAGVMSNASGTITRILVSEGDLVKAGQVMFELSIERHSTDGDVTAMVAKQLTFRALSVESERRNRTLAASDQRRKIDDQIRIGDAQLAQMRDDVTIYERRVSLAQQTLKKYVTLQAEGFISSAQVQQKQEELLDVMDKANIARRGLLQLSSARSELMAEQSAITTGLNLTLTQLDEQKAEISQEIAENSLKKHILVLAPASGCVSTITYKIGQPVMLGQPIATIVPSSAHSADTKSNLLEAQLFVPSRSIGFVAIGQAVEIRYQAYPYQKFGLQSGIIVDVSRTPFAPNELPSNLLSAIQNGNQQNAVGQGEPLYRVRVMLTKQTINVYGTDRALRIGMTLDADILQDERKIWEWALEPILAFRTNF